MKTIESKLKNALKDAQNIIITTHLFPDADGIGSQIALCLALRKLNKNAICVNEEPLLDRYQYLDSEKTIIGLSEYLNKPFAKIDLVIVVDTNAIFRTGPRFSHYIDKEPTNILYIDHHPCHENLKEGHCIDTTAAATGQLVGHLIETLGVDFDKKIALPLYTAILIDTSSFRYPTVTASTHALVAKLMATGIEPPRAYNGIYGTGRIEHMHLLGSVLSSTDCNKDRTIAWIVLKKEELKSFAVDIEDTHAFINHLLILENIKMACMFRDDGNRIKISFRSTGKIDVGFIASGLGGGGHSHSSATIINLSPGDKLETVIQDTIKKIEFLIKTAEAM